MRKRLKMKQRSCCLCKPQKMGIANRWKSKDLAKIQDFEKIKKEIVG